MPEEKAQGDQGQQGGEPDGSGAEIAIELEGKKYGVEEVKQLVNQIGAATQSNQIAAKLKDISGKYGVDPTNYLTQAEGALSVISDLIDRGIIDEKGEIVQNSNKSSTGKQSTGDKNMDDLFGLETKEKGEGTGISASNIEDIVAKATQPLVQHISQLQDIQAGMIREDYGKKIQEKFPNLDGEDISRVFAAYQRNKSTGLMEHAKALAERKTSFLEEHEKKLAEKWGVDLEKIKQKEQGDINSVKDAGEGGAGVLFKGKKFSMREKGEGIVSPKEAAREYFGKVFGE